MFLRGTTLLGCSKVSVAAMMLCWLQLAQCYGAQLRSYLLPMILPLLGPPFLFLCFLFYSTVPTLVFQSHSSYFLIHMHLFLLYFFSPLRQPYLQKLNGVTPLIITLLNTHHHENLEGKRYCLCAHLSTMPWGHMGKWRINSIHFGIQH